MDLSCGPKFSRALVILNLANIKLNLGSSKKINKILMLSVLAECLDSNCCTILQDRLLQVTTRKTSIICTENYLGLNSPILIVILTAKKISAP